MIFALCLLASSFFYINEPVVDMRETDSSASKVVSQAIYAEKVEVEKTAGEWSYIMTSDGYMGWISSHQLITREESYQPDIAINRLKAHLYSVADIEYGPSLSLPYRAELKVLDDSDARWISVALPDGSQAYVQRGDVAPLVALTDKSQLPAFSQTFLGLPYTWGGRSSFGYDCSGFVQMLYSQIGICLPRDARLQIADPQLQPITMDELAPGDLLFFGKSAEKITHVGMYIGHGSFIHAATIANRPWIHVSGIFDLSSRCPYIQAMALKTSNLF